MKKRFFSSYIRNTLLLFIPLTLPGASFGQSEIPIGTWRSHLSFSQIISLTVSDSHVYAASQMGVMIYDKNDETVRILNKLNGLSHSGITTVTFDNKLDLLLVAYTNGSFDVISENEVTTITTLRDTDIIGSKKINSIVTRNHLAYLATDFGVVIFDLLSKEIKETWRDLGSNGEKISIIQLAFSGDSIFAATSQGVIEANLAQNLLDFNNWKHFNVGELNTRIEGIAMMNNQRFIIIDQQGIYAFSNGSYEKQDVLAEKDFNSISAHEENLLISTTEAVWKLSTDLLPENISTNLITKPGPVLSDNDAIWIGDNSNGLLSDLTGEFQKYLPNGPSSQMINKLRFVDGKMFAFNDGLTTFGSEDVLEAGVDYFENNIWKQKDFYQAHITDIEVWQSKLALSSFTNGLRIGDDIYNETNSTFQRIAGDQDSVSISSIATTQSGLFALNYGALIPLHLLSTNNTWQSFAEATSIRYATDFVVDDFGQLWCRINPSFGGGLVVFNPTDGTSIARKATVGNGGLLNDIVHSIAIDRDGYIWAGTNTGLGYFYSKDADAVIPIFENRFLLKDEKILAIEVDGGNRKWMGTENGAWLFNEEGEELIKHFTTENSPLLSNHIYDIEINPQTGEVFFATANGLISYRSDASGVGTSSEIKIFPNPVMQNFTGSVGINGVPTDAYVKITDISGKLIWQTQANGSTATWNVQDYNGRRASPGVYLVFAATGDAQERMVGKIAVVE